MVGGVEPTAGKVKADPGGHILSELPLGGDRIGPLRQQRVIGAAGGLGTGPDERHEPLAKLGESRRDRPPPPPRFVVVEQRVVGIEVGTLAGGLLPLEGENLLEPGFELGPRGFRPGRHPGLLRLHGCPGKLCDESRRKPGLFVEVVFEEADRRLLCGAASGGQRPGGEGLEPLPLSPVGAMPMDNRREFGCLVGPPGSRRRRHHRAFVPAHERVHRGEHRPPPGVIAGGGEELGGSGTSRHGCDPRGGTICEGRL